MMVSKKFGETYKKSLKSWIRIKFKICLVKQQRRFLIRCRSFDVVPPHIYNLKFNVTLKDFQLDRKYYNLKKNFQKKLLNLEIKDIHSQINYLMLKVENIEKFLSSRLPCDLLKRFFESNCNRFQKYNREIKEKLVNKFNKIRSYQNTYYNNFFNMDKSKWIINYSSKEIPDYVKNILSLGERFALPINVNDSKDRLDTVLGIVKNFEASIFKFPEQCADKLRAMVVNSLNRNLYRDKHFNYFDAHIHKEFVKCKNFLKNNEDIFVTKADKGQVTVIMDKNAYVDQMLKILDDENTYRPVKNNPLRKITTRLDSLIKTWSENGIIDDCTYRGLKCTNGNLPRCYGLPKIHKPGYPLRIVVSSVGSPLYEVAKFLHGILKTSIKKPMSFTKDSWSFVKSINGKIIEPHEIFISLDVTSLFTNIPKELVIQGIENRWTDIQKNTKLNLTQMICAIDMVLSSTSFAFNGKYYEQIYGSPMGSPLSPILADIVMEDLETLSLQKLNFVVHTYYRYVDDILMIIPATKLDSVLNVFNSYHPRLKFTYEAESNNMLNFLNTSVIRQDDGTIITNWYRKPTFSGRYINFYSNHPYQYKLNTITNLVDHAILLSDERFHVTNLEIIKSILLNNGYPISVVQKQIKKRCKMIENNKMTGDGIKHMNNNDNKNYTLTVPFVNNVSNDIKRIVRNFVDVRFTIPKKLDNVIKRGKDKLNNQQITEVVYKINCNDCDKVYIGQTKRHLVTRIKEHMNNIKNPSGNFSVVTEHRLSFNHNFDWDNPNFLHKEKNRKKREIAEMFFIKKFNNTINLQKDTENLNPIYDKIIFL